MSNQRVSIPVKGMFCVNCEKTIKNAVKELNGVKSVSASFKNEQVWVNFDDSKVTLDAIKDKIKEAGYEPKDSDSNRLIVSAILILILGLYVVASHMGWLDFFNIIPNIDETVSMSMLFVIGLLTSVHCVAMCGGINLTQGAIAAKSESTVLKSNVLYNLGRVISYTVVGALAGGIGSLISFSGHLRSAIFVIVGVAMMIMAFSMLGIFSPVRKLSFHFSGKLYGTILKRVNGNSSLVIGLLNGLMPCGPLQSMQLYALSTGSVVKGAVAMFLFSLGTVPLMFGFGFVASKLNQKYKKVMLTVSAVLIFVIGINMISNGLSLSGITVAPINNGSQLANENGSLEESYSSEGGESDNQAEATEGDVQKAVSNVDWSYYEPITVKAGVPVEWTIIVPEGKLTGCNSQIIVPEYGLQIPLQEGENVVNFTPTEAGVFSYTCWMGMIRSQITVE
ncbi:MAG: sulfite exporter TauE/SafE family protein [Pseudobutyrivibrio sp.]|nr:sulfite exporter TauE/SafE family protein [Pseudobutyrivibrio sp.]